jgi:hypothetical protein
VAHLLLEGEQLYRAHLLLEGEHLYRAHLLLEGEPEGEEELTTLGRSVAATSASPEVGDGGSGHGGPSGLGG